MPEPPDMPCVSDTGATAPISALTYAFSIGFDPARAGAGFGPKSCMAEVARPAPGSDIGRRCRAGSQHIEASRLTVLGDSARLV